MSTSQRHRSGSSRCRVPEMRHDGRGLITVAPVHGDRETPPIMQEPLNLAHHLARIAGTGNHVNLVGRLAYWVSPPATSACSPSGTSGKSGKSGKSRSSPGVYMTHRPMPPTIAAVTTTKHKHVPPTHAPAADNGACGEIGELCDPDDSVVSGPPSDLDDVAFRNEPVDSVRAQPHRHRLESIPARLPLDPKRQDFYLALEVDRSLLGSHVDAGGLHQRFDRVGSTFVGATSRSSVAREGLGGPRHPPWWGNSHLLLGLHGKRGLRAYVRGGNRCAAGRRSQLGLNHRLTCGRQGSPTSSDTPPEPATTWGNAGSGAVKLDDGLLLRGVVPVACVGSSRARLERLGCRRDRFRAGDGGSAGGDGDSEHGSKFAD